MLQFVSSLPNKRKAVEPADGKTSRYGIYVPGPEPNPSQALAIERIGLPPWLIARLKHLASLHNPKFYENERLRMSNHATPRLIRCYLEELDVLRLPRGLLDDVVRIVDEAGSRLELDDQRNHPAAAEFKSSIVLTAVQQTAFDALIGHEQAVLVAPTGAGKTVMACALIAAHNVPTLILVERTQLAEQWKEQLMLHLGLTRRQVGRMAATTKASGIVDIATLQAVARRPDAAKLFAGYGLVIVDECHHLPARSFEIAVRDAASRRWLGLTATPYRRDGLEAIITMQCGPVRHEIALADTASAALARRLFVHDTASTAGQGEITAIQDVFRALVDDEQRTRLIVADINLTVAAGRNVLVLTQWTDHVDQIAERLTAAGRHPLVLKGGMGKKARAAVLAQLDDPNAAGQLVVATGSYIGEGFDCPTLDTLFLVRSTSSGNDRGENRFGVVTITLAAHSRCSVAPRRLRSSCRSSTSRWACASSRLPGSYFMKTSKNNPLDA